MVLICVVKEGQVRMEPQQARRFLDVRTYVFQETKYIKLDCHVGREMIQNDTLHLLPISSQMQLADKLIKPLAAGHFRDIQSKLGMFNIHIPA
ncbi:hypothetical protein CR513_62441, partial [Mucuna pruriens]